MQERRSAGSAGLIEVCHTAIVTFADTDPRASDLNSADLRQTRVGLVQYRDGIAELAGLPAG